MSEGVISRRIREISVQRAVAEMREQAEADPTPAREVTFHDFGSVHVTLDTRG